MNEKEGLIARPIILVATLLGAASMLLFGFFLLKGPPGLIEIGLSQPSMLAWDGLLSTAFFVQHSCMIRRGFRTRLSHLVPTHYGDAVFTIASGIVLASVVVLWQTSATVLLELNGPLRWIARGVFLLSVAGLGWGVYALRSFDLFGRAAMEAHLSGKPIRARRFRVTGPYLWVRHPLYFFVILLIWSCPYLTLDRLLFNLLWTAWICAGTVLEERDLVADFGEDYRQYQAAVPMLIPWKGRRNGRF